MYMCVAKQQNSDHDCKNAFEMKIQKYQLNFAKVRFFQEFSCQFRPFEAFMYNGPSNM